LAYATIKQNLSTSQQYGLLEIKHGTGYRVTPLFVKIFRPVNDTEKNQGIIESLRTPELYKGLIELFQSHIVPPVTGLTNVILRKYDFKDKIAERAAEIFLQNLKDFGLLNANNVLILNPSFALVRKEEGETIIEDETKEETRLKDTPIEHSILENPEVVNIVIPLKSGGKKAHLLIPDNYTTEDLERIAKFVEALK
jgi:hypothetical protein